MNECKCGHPAESHVDRTGECFSEHYIGDYNLIDCVCDKYEEKEEQDVYLHTD